MADRDQSAHSDLARALSRVRTRAMVLLHWHGLLSAAAAAALWLLAGVVLVQLVELVAWGRALYWIGLGLVAAGAYAWCGLRRRRRYASDEQMALLIQRELPELKDAPINAVQLPRQLDGGAAFSPELVQAYVQDASSRVRHASHRVAVQDVPVMRSFGAAALSVLALGAAVLLLPGTFWGALGLLARGRTEQPSAPAQAAVLEVADLRVVLQFPQYTGLEPDAAEGSDGALRGVKGTQASLSGRLTPTVQEGHAVVNDAERHELALREDGRFEVTFLLIEKGTYRFEGRDAAGRLLASETRPIHLLRDNVPFVRILSLVPQPGPDGVVEGDAGGMIEIGYSASDDFGLAEVFLQYEHDGEAVRQEIAKPEQPRSSERGTYQWVLPREDAWLGGDLSFRLGVKDNDNISGPNEAFSRTVLVRLVTPEMRHRAVTEQTERLRRLMVRLLGLELAAQESGLVGEGKDDVPLAGVEAFVRDFFERVVGVITLNRFVLGAMEEDPLADKTLYDALEEMLHRRSSTRAKVSAATRPLFRSAGAEEVAPDVRRVLGRMMQESIPALEEDVLRLDDLLAMEYMRSARRLAERLMDLQKDIAEMLRKAREGKLTEEELRDLKRKIAAMRRMLAELSQQMAQTARQVEREFLNPDALKLADSREEFQKALDRIEELAEKGELDQALAEAQQLADELGRMMEGLKSGGSRLASSRLGEQYRKLMALQEGLKKVRADEAALSKDTTALDHDIKDKVRERHGAELDKTLGDIKKKTERLSTEVAALKKQLATEDDLAEYRKLREQIRSLAIRGRGAEAAELAKQMQGMKRPAAAHGVLQQVPAVSGGVQELWDNLAALDITAALKDAGDLERLIGNWEDALRRGGLADKPRGMAEQAAGTSGEIRGDLEGLQRRLREATAQVAQKVGGERFGQMAGRQGQALGDLGELTQKFGKGTSQAMGRAIDGAAQHMKSAREHLAEKDAESGLRREKSALSHLDEAIKQAKEEAKKMAQNMKGRAARMSRGMRRYGPYGHSVDKVKIPDPSDYRVPEAFRGAITRALQDGLPAAYREWNERYYEELVK